MVSVSLEVGQVVLYCMSCSKLHAVVVACLDLRQGEEGRRASGPLPLGRPRCLGARRLSARDHAHQPRPSPTIPYCFA